MSEMKTICAPKSSFIDHLYIFYKPRLKPFVVLQNPFSKCTIKIPSWKIATPFGAPESGHLCEMRECRVRFKPLGRPRKVYVVIPVGQSDER